MTAMRWNVQHVFSVRSSDADRYGLDQIRSSSIALAFSVIGLLWISSKVFRLVLVLLELYVLPGMSLKRFGAANGKSNFGKGSWAVVTGATDGIGREFALQLARKGFNVFLASRTPEKLGQVAAEIEQQTPGIKTKTQSIDFSAGDDSQYAVLAAGLKGLDIGVLVNNVGMSHDMPVPFAETPEEEMLRIAEINVKATLRVTRIVAPGMVDRYVQ